MELNVTTDYGLIPKIFRTHIIIFYFIQTGTEMRLGGGQGHAWAAEVDLGEGGGVQLRRVPAEYQGGRNV